MIQTLSYAIEIKNRNKSLRPTIKIFNDAVTFCVNAFEQYWDEFQVLDNHERIRFGEALVHKTRTNDPVFKDFDVIFYGMPAYFRRSAIQSALGYLSSYHSNLDNWECSVSDGKPPMLQTHLNKFPSFYKDNMYRDDCEGDAVRLKLYDGKNWNWVKLDLKHTDVVSIRKHMRNAKMSVPTLERKNKKWFLRFAFTEEVELNTTPVLGQKILAVDLGINNDATCCVMDVDGAILAREFINFASDKDRLCHTLNKIKGVQQKYGSGTHNSSRLWRDASFHNEELARKVAIAITDLAVKYGCSVIVMEHLDFKGKIRGSKKQMLHMWKKKSIQAKVEHKAHTNGIRISRVNAWNTSKLAFDGSGMVQRGKAADLPTYILCRFQNGKVYNCDLSASYNIGARYFIREVQKILPAMVWSDIVAKVPECQKRTRCTYSTLVQINKVV